MKLNILRLLGFLLFVPLILAKDPEIVEKTPFPGRPDALYYFDDSEVILTVDKSSSILYSSTNGGKDWAKVSGVPAGDANRIYLNPNDNKIAIVVGDALRQHITEDQGKTWRTFDTPAPPDFVNSAISFHWSDPKRILFHTPHYTLTRIGESFYTTDGFETIHVLHNRRRFCDWAKSTEQFSSGTPEIDANRVLCIVESPNSERQQDFKLLVSDDYFDSRHEPKIFNDRTVSGMVNMAAVKGFIVVAAKLTGSSELVLYVTKDTNTWHRAIFGEHRIEEDSYTILESTNYSIQVQVTPDAEAYVGVLYSSNSNGTYFTKLWDHVDRDEYGIMDFEKMQNIQGVFTINAVDNWKEYQENPRRVTKKLKSKITFDDGRNFESLKAGDEELHLHSVTELINTGRVFSSPAPGIVLGNGNTGDFLSTLDDSSVFVSDDAGKTWAKTSLKGLHKYEFGDQGGVLLAMSADFTNEISYSLNHGKTWTTVSLGETKVSAYELTTVPDSTSLKFTLSARDNDSKWYIFCIDFGQLHERKCASGDFEEWYARKDDKGNPACLMGHTQHFRRRKADAECVVGVEFDEALPISETCDCTDDDFECDFNFRKQEGECVLIGRLLDPDGKCKDYEDKFMGSSGWRLIPGNDCKRTRGAQKDNLVEHSCSDVLGDPASGQIERTFTPFRGTAFDATYYLERDPKAVGTDETVLALIDYKAYKSHDHGKTWDLAVNEPDEIIAIYKHDHNNDYIYFITPSTTVYYSKDRAQNVHKFTAPDIPNYKGMPIINFHQTKPDWLIWTGNQNCLDNDAKYCHTSAHVSKKNGADGSWFLLEDYVKRCQFMYRENRASFEDLVFCEHWHADNVGGPLELLKSEDEFKTKEVIFDDIADFATMAEFIVVAGKTEDGKYLKAFASVDGQNFAHAEYPENFPVKHETAYTVLDSDTNAVFLHVTESGERGREYGPIMKSNSNGTSYVISIRNVNRNVRGYVDWEKMQGLEGVAVVNVVGNVDDVSRGVNKKLKSMITHDDGATWAYLSCPEKSLDGVQFGCDKNNLAARSLHLHGYTERKDPRDTFSSPTAVGLMVGVGNVGEYLGLYNEGNTFLTQDGGITWKQIQKGAYLWEYGDQGSLIVLVERNTPTSKVLYSTDEGNTWQTYTFDDDGVTTVERITTVPSDNSRNFLLWGKRDGKLNTVNLDFTGLTSAQCFLPDKENMDDSTSDYTLWWPEHPGREEPECLFGHKSLYYRKKSDRKCYNGPVIERLHAVERNCSCIRQDFEW
jgi:photosystem II stability/assembly factor-like uncharacterized protein